jgi:hypothetical protein
VIASINAWLDGLPRARFGSRTREVPAFRSVGVAGFYLAVLVTMGTGLATGRSPVILAIVSIACGLSFFAWALLRRTVVRREAYSLFEQVWFALVCATGVIVAFGEPPLAYLDPVALGLCAFLSTGRIGCLLVGCCHGQPSIVGIRYGSELVGDGFPSWLLGVRLFPVQLVEAAGIALIGVVGAVFAIGATAGTAFVWFLVAYAILRFGMEGLRGDERASFGGLSGPRWMALVQGGAALAIADPLRLVGPAGAVLVGTLTFVLMSMALWRRQSGGVRLTSSALLESVREFIREAASSGTSSRDGVNSRRFGQLSAAVSAMPDGAAHVSFALPPGDGDLRRLAEVAASTLGDPIPAGPPASARSLHVVAHPAMAPLGNGRLATFLYGDILRSLDTVPAASDPATPPPEPATRPRSGYFDAPAWPTRSDVERARSPVPAGASGDS